MGAKRSGPNGCQCRSTASCGRLGSKMGIHESLCFVSVCRRPSHGNMGLPAARPRRILASPTLARTDDWDRGSFKTDSSHNSCKKRRESHCPKHLLLAQTDMRSIDAYPSGG